MSGPVNHSVHACKLREEAMRDDDAGRCIITPKVDGLDLSSVPRTNLETILRAAADVEAFSVPWDSTVVIAADRWRRLEAATPAALERVPGICAPVAERAIAG